MIWWSDLVGLPYEDNARGPGRFDCYGLVRHVLQRECGIDLPLHDGVDSRCEATVTSEMEAQEASGPFVEVVLPGPFDVVMMTRSITSCVYGHVGIMVSEKQVLHTWRRTGSCVMRIDDYRVAPRIMGFYRHRGLL